MKTTGGRLEYNPWYYCSIFVLSLLSLQTVFSDNDTVPEIDPSQDIHIAPLPDLGSDSEFSSIRLKSTTPSLQNPGRRSPSIELTIYSGTSDQRNWDTHGLFGAENRQDSSDFVTPCEQGDGVREDKFMTPVRLPPPGAKYSQPVDDHSRPSSPSSPFRLLMTTESPYKMPPPLRGKISRSQSQRELSDSGSQEETRPSGSIPTTKSLNTFKDIHIDPSSFTADISKKFKDNFESLLYESSTG